ncbi:TonB-dependent receptor [Woodsholea maritima]|uniref:TonB-dependent receptor n=1 Tax=Woodsholea maritima TaxID=240237 RepID=UPI0003740BA4|nr:TonB-dependent receptor [Woodsholea maritima]
MSRLASKWQLTLATSALALTGVTLPAVAQDAPERRTIEVITVTAQQREESLQDVPLSMAAYDEVALKNAGVKDIKDLMSLAPGLMVTSTQSETITTARIRGIGTVGDNFGLESSVGVYIDGVFRSRNGVSFQDIGEIAGIEVLRGPQGTLFGKNTSAGVLNISTVAPDMDEFGGHLEGTFGDYGYRRISGGITGPIVEDQLAFRLFAVKGDRDGYMDLVVDDGSSTTVQDSETQDYYSIRGQLLWTPNDQVSGRIIADYSNRDEMCCSAVQWDYTAAAAAFVNSVGGQAAFPADPDARIGFSNRPFVQDIQDWGISGEFDFELGFGTLTSVTAFRNWENSRSQDIDYSSADLAYRDVDNNYTDLDRFSQEFRLQGVNGKLDWLIGGFFSREDLKLSDGIRFGADWEPYLGRLLTAGTVPPLGTPAGVSATISNVTFGGVNIPPGFAIPGGTGVNQDNYDQSATSWAIFTHNSYALTERLTLTAGLRYTHEKKELEADFSTTSPLGCGALEQAFGYDPVAGFVAAATQANAPDATIAGGARAIGLICLPYARSGLDSTGYDQSRTDKEVSGTIRLDYQFNDDVMGYAGFSRGFKAGGFNLDRQFNGTVTATGIQDVNSGFAPEIVDAYEIGFKSQLFDDVVRLNANLFYQTIDDFQLNSFTGTAFVVESIEEIKSKGLELDFYYLPPIDGLEFTGGYAYVDAQYGDNITNTGLAGKTISLSPENFFTLAMTYEREIFDGYYGLFSVDGRWVTDYNTGSDLDPEKAQDGFGMINARLGLSREDQAWSIELWGKNLTDETYAQVAFDAFGQGSRAGDGSSNGARSTASYAAFLGAPRTWGVTLRTEW